MTTRTTWNAKLQRNLTFTKVAKADVGEILADNNVDELQYVGNDYKEFWTCLIPGSRRPYYLGRGHKDGPGQIVVWFPNGNMWSSYGSTLNEAIELATADAYLYF